MPQISVPAPAERAPAEPSGRQLPTAQRTEVPKEDRKVRHCLSVLEKEWTRNRKAAPVVLGQGQPALLHPTDCGLGDVQPVPTYMYVPGAV